MRGLGGVLAVSWRGWATPWVAGRGGARRGLINVEKFLEFIARTCRRRHRYGRREGVSGFLAGKAPHTCHTERSYTPFLWRSGSGSGHFTRQKKQVVTPMRKRAFWGRSRGLYLQSTTGIERIGRPSACGDHSTWKGGFSSKACSIEFQQSGAAHPTKSAEVDS